MTTKMEFYFENNKSVLGVPQNGGGLPRGRGALMRQGARLTRKVSKHKKIVQEEIADLTKKTEPKLIEEEGEEETDDSSEIQNNLLRGDTLAHLLR